MKKWTIPTIYTGASLVAAAVLPRLEYYFLPQFVHGMSVSSATAFLSAAASGIMTFTAIIVSIAFIIVQFSAIAYSPRLVLWYANRPELYHALGIFIATFTYAMATLLWTDRNGSGSVPLLSTMLVLGLLAASMIIFSLLVQNLTQLQITEVLRMIGDEGRRTIAHQQSATVGELAVSPAAHQPRSSKSGPHPYYLVHSGSPRSVTAVDIEALLKLAEMSDCTIIVAAAIGDTVMEGSWLLVVKGARTVPSEALLRKAVRLGRERTFEQDPKYAIRLLVDIAIKALSPAINDPTTAVQALDQIEDLLRRLGAQELGSRWFVDSQREQRVYLPMPTWEDYLSLSFHEIRQFGVTSIQVIRRLAATLDSLQTVLSDPDKRLAVKQYRAHLDRAIRRSEFDPQDQVTAMMGDQQGLGLSPNPPRPRTAQRKSGSNPSK